MQTKFRLVAVSKYPELAKFLDGSTEKPADHKLYTTWISTKKWKEEFILKKKRCMLVLDVAAALRGHCTLPVAALVSLPVSIPLIIAMFQTVSTDEV